MRALNCSAYGLTRPAGTAPSTAVPGVLLTWKRSQVQTLARPPGTTYLLGSPLRAACQQITSCDRWSTLSADRFGCSDSPDELGFVIAEAAHWPWAGSSSAPGPPRTAPPD